MNLQQKMLGLNTDFLDPEIFEFTDNYHGFYWRVLNKLFQQN